MDKSVIDKMNKEEILELLSPYLSAGESAVKYYEMIEMFDVIIKLTDDPKYAQGRIDISVNMVEFNGDDKWVDVGSVGSAIYGDVVAKYRDMVINKIIQ